jgi:putative transcriptional regulator
MSVPSVNIRSIRKARFMAAVVIAAALVVVAALFTVGSVLAGAHAGLLPVRKPDAPALPEPDPFSDALPAKGKFLVASRTLVDPRFQETVVLLISYGTEGAAGLIINRPTKVPLAEMLPSVPDLKKRADVVYYGGPVEGHRILMLIRSGEKPEESGRVFGNVYVSSSGNTLERMIGAHKPEKQLRFYAGYAGWLPGQLDGEVSRGDWHIVRADADSIFEKKSSEIWRELFRRASAIQVWNHGEPDFALAPEAPSLLNISPAFSLFFLSCTPIRRSFIIPASLGRRLGEGELF